MLAARTIVAIARLKGINPVINFIFLHTQHTPLHNIAKSQLVLYAFSDGAMFCVHLKDPISGIHL